MLTDLLVGRGKKRRIEKASQRRAAAGFGQAELPVEAEDSPGLAAGGEREAGQGSAGWPVSCAGTGAECAGMQVGSLLEHKEKERQ